MRNSSQEPIFSCSLRFSHDTPHHRQQFSSASRMNQYQVEQLEQAVQVARQNTVIFCLARLLVVPICLRPEQHLDLQPRNSFGGGTLLRFLEKVKYYVDQMSGCRSVSFPPRNEHPEGLHDGITIQKYPQDCDCRNMPGEYRTLRATPCR